ncbi:MAG: hypothetical protein MI863_05765 [Desulfobacterales bacterium]|nr:hypothetical protein [Desulfobacterales bacterium]
MTRGTVYDRRLYWKKLWKKRNYPFALNMVPMIVDYDRQGRIGPLVLDLGCSCIPVSNWLDLSRCKRILLDVSPHVHDLSELPDSPLTVECDLCAFDYGSKGFAAFERTIARAGTEKIDTIIAADNLINYIPWASVFETLDRYLKINGLVFICFGLNIGRGEAFHSRRPFSPGSVIEFFEKKINYDVLEYGTQKGCHGLVLRKGG